MAMGKAPSAFGCTAIRTGTSTCCQERPTAAERGIQRPGSSAKHMSESESECKAQVRVRVRVQSTTMQTKSRTMAAACNAFGIGFE
eukprot:364870-Chlamydomonas_euryale.AAC.6